MGTWQGTPKPYRSTSGATAVFDKPDDVVYALNDVIVFDLSEQGTVSGTTPIGTPAGVVRIGGANGAGDRAAGWFAYVVTDPANVPATFTFTGFTTGRGVGFAYVRRGVDITTLQHTSPPYSSTDLAAFTADGTPLLYLMSWTDQRTSPRSHVPTSTPAAATPILNIQSPDTGTTGSRTAIWAGYLTVPAGGSTAIAAQALVWPDGVSANKAVGAVLLELPDTPVLPGIPVEVGTAEARLTFMEGGIEKAPAAINIWLPGHNDVEAFLSTPGGTAAHRGGSLVNPEYAEIAYDRCVFRNFDPLEFSCAFTLDNEPFGMGDQYMDRAAGVTGNVDPTTMTWANLQANYRNVLRPVASGVTQPFYSLEDFLDKYTRNQVVMVDPKFGWNTPAKVARMLDLCDQYGGPDRIIIKYDFPVTDPYLVNAAHARTSAAHPNGYVTMNYWGTNQAALTPTYHTDKWDLIGVAYNADQAMYDAAIAIGKPVWAAVIPDQAGYNLAASRGADLMMCANPNTIAPVR